MRIFHVNFFNYYILIILFVICFFIEGVSLKPEFKIGIVLPLSGSMKMHGQEVLNGINLALTTLKNQNPDLYSRIKIVVKDDKSLTSMLTDIVKDLVNKDKVQIIVGSLPLSTTLTLAKLVSSYKRILVSPVISHQAVIQVAEGIYQTAFSVSYEAKLLSAFALDHLKVNKAVILIDHASENSKAFAKNFELVFSKNGGQILKTYNYTFNTKELNKIFAQIKSLKPQVIVMGAHYNVVAEVLKKARSQKINTVFLGNSDWDSPVLYEKIGKDLIKTNYYVSHYSFDVSDKFVQNFLKNYNELYNKAPTYFAAMGYDNMLIIAAVCQNTNTTLNSSLINSFKKIKNVKTLMGKASMLPSGEIEKTGVIMKTTPVGPKFHNIIEYFTIN